MTVNHVRYNSFRKKKYALSTVIGTENGKKLVKKLTTGPESSEHINSIFRNYDLLKDQYTSVNICPCIQVSSDELIFDFIPGETLGSVFVSHIKAGRRKELIDALYAYKALLLDNGKLVPGQALNITPQFSEIFGQYEGPYPFEYLDVCNIDMIFDNLLLNSEKTYTVIDYEWVFTFPIPIKYTMYRSVRSFFDDRNAGGLFSSSEIYNILDITQEEVTAYEKMESHFSQYVHSTYNAHGRYLHNASSLNSLIEGLRQNTSGPEPPLQATVYIDTGNGFSEDSSIKLPTKTFNNMFDHFIPLPHGTKKARFDPLEGKACVIRNLEIQTNMGKQPYKNHNGQTMLNWEVFRDTDPQIYVEIEGSNINFLKITGEIFDFKIDELWIVSGMIEFDAEQNRLKDALAANESEISIKNGQITENRNIIAEKTSIILSLEENRAALEENIIKISSELDSTETRYDKLQKISTQDKQEIEILKDNLENQSREIEMLKELLEVLKYNLEIQNHELNKLLASNQNKEQELHNIYTSKIWRITKPYRWLALKIRNIAYRILWRGKSEEQATEEHVIAEPTETPLEDPAKTETPLQNLMETITPYISEYQDNMDFTGFQTDVKVLAFYLPQFHRIPENDRWWGEGFTEWTNTRKSIPRFEGHYQPREPHDDFGYYSLDTMESFVDTMQKQARLAKQHGIYGFCFYHYWFSGKRLLEKPVDMLLRNPQIDINFCLCWANENWTRTWDGLEEDVLMAQEYSEEDPKNFIKDLAPYVQDPRYVRVEGKPLIMVYNPSCIPSAGQVFKGWRKHAEDIGIGEILIWVCEGKGITDEDADIEAHIDASIEFPPLNFGAYFYGEVAAGDGAVLDYELAVKHKRDEIKKLPAPGSYSRYKTVMAGWDNAARRSVGFSTYTKYSLDSFYNWCCDTMAYTRKAFEPEKRFAFVNAWNEWAEGTYLEPDKKYGYANINTLSKALYQLPLYDTAMLYEHPFAYDSPSNAKIAVQVHLFFVDLLDEIIETLNVMPFKYDCFISTDSDDKKEVIENRFRDSSNANDVYVEVYKNRGRDVAPFLMQMKDRIDRYDYICHIHSKKSSTVDFGDAWRNYLYKNLFGSESNVRQVFRLFEDYPSLGVIFPKIYHKVLPVYEWGGNEKDTAMLLNKLGKKVILSDPPVFPAGNMFWAKTCAVKETFQLGLTDADYPPEDGQVNATLAHSVERHWVYLAMANGYGYMMVHSSISEDLDNRY